MNANRIKELETGLVLTTAFVLLYLILSVSIFLYLSFAIGVLFIFIKPLATRITFAWFKLADGLNFIVSKIILGTLFFAVLFPVSLAYKIWNRDKLRLKRSKKSLWKNRGHKYCAADLKNIW